MDNHWHLTGIVPAAPGMYRLEPASETGSLIVLWATISTNADSRVVGLTADDTSLTWPMVIDDVDELFGGKLTTQVPAHFKTIR